MEAAVAEGVRAVARVAVVKEAARAAVVMLVARVAYSVAGVAPRVVVAKEE